MNSESSQKKELEPMEEIEKILSSSDKVEDKIEATLQFMRNCLAQSEAPLFREFWEARKQLIPLYKEISSAYARSTLWKQLMEITDEAKKIRDILDEKSAFHVEQIEIALQALEEDLANYQTLLATFDAPTFSYSLLSKKEIIDQQKEIDLLTIFSVRLSSLRKEILALDMRMRKKNILLKRINAMQDELLPKRKELIKEISEKYASVVNQFEKKFSESQKEKISFFQSKADIKALQSDGKRLTLLSQTFADTRKKLSACWDSIREIQLGKKAEREKMKEQDEEHIQAAREKMAIFKKMLEEETIAVCENQKTEVQNFIRSLPLSKGSMKILSNELDLLRKELAEKKAKAKAVEREKLEKLAEEIESFLQSEPSQEILQEKEKAFSDRLHTISLSSSEKKMAETLLRKLKDLQQAKEEDEMLEKDPSKFHEVLEQKLDRVKAIKERIEELKKEISASNLDFSKAISLQEMMEEEKERLYNLNKEIASLEES